MGLLLINKLPDKFYPQYQQDNDRNILLGKDFAIVINQLAASKPKVLIYEIQMQFYAKSNLVSADGIVGGEFIKVLLKIRVLSIS